LWSPPRRERGAPASMAFDGLRQASRGARRGAAMAAEELRWPSKSFDGRLRAWMAFDELRWPSRSSHELRCATVAASQCPALRPSAGLRSRISGGRDLGISGGSMALSREPRLSRCGVGVAEGVGVPLGRARPREQVPRVWGGASMERALSRLPAGPGLPSHTALLIRRRWPMHPLAGARLATS